jgi:hypothetical protein
MRIAREYSRRFGPAPATHRSDRHPLRRDVRPAALMRDWAMIVATALFVTLVLFVLFRILL